MSTAKKNARLVFATALVSTLPALAAIAPVIAEPPPLEEAADPTTPNIDPPPATSESAQRLAAELARTAERYGPDAVALQASLLVSSLRAGAVGATEVRVAGKTGTPPAERLRIEVVTGLRFAGDVTTPGDRADRIWDEVVAPVLVRMESFDIRPPNLELEVSYEVADDAVADSPAVVRGVAYAFDREALENLLLERTGTAALRAASGGGGERAAQVRRVPAPPIE